MRTRELLLAVSLTAGSTFSEVWKQHSRATRAMLTSHGLPISPPAELPTSLAKPCRIASIVAVANQLLVMSYNAAVMNDS
jgi:hypothetical protein